MFDTYTFTAQHMRYVGQETSNGHRLFETYETDNFKMNCRSWSQDARCYTPIFWFKENPSSIEEAFTVLKDHLPLDVEVTNQFQHGESHYVINATSKLLKKSYYRVLILDNWEYKHENPIKMSIRFKFDSDGSVEVASLSFEHVESQ